VSYSYAADQTFSEYRDRLVLWLHKPGKGKRLFATDLQRWRYDDQGPDPLVVEQQRWAEEQVTATTHQPPEHAPSLPVNGAASALPAFGTGETAVAQQSAD
jgi:hypothetical protein